MRLLAISFVLLHLILVVNRSDAREITHEDIKDAMLSLVHMMRENTEKLERHEVRERQLGEQVKKAISLLSKRVSAIDGLKTHLTKLDERIGGIEQLISQRDERERVQMQKTADGVELLESHLNSWFTNVDNKLAENNRRTDTEVPRIHDNRPSEIMVKLNKTEAAIGGELARLEFALEAINNKLGDGPAKLLVVSEEVTKIGTRISDIEASLEVLKSKAQQLHEKVGERKEDVSPTLEGQTQMLERLKELAEETSERIQQLPKTTDVHGLHNETQAVLQETKHALREAIAREVHEVNGKVQETNQETKDAIGELRLDLANNADRVNEELKDLGKGQSVMVSMADHVLDTKKRVEYGVHQILLEVGDLVKAQSVHINDTLNSRFDGISNDIMDNQNGAVANLTTKMEQEMNQVWRQINVMYQQMTESAKALDKLHKQNEAYVNGTTTTMGGMESKVGEITKRMAEVDENLNYLLGRLSLVTQEFNQIKSGLGAALDNIKASFKEVQEKANDLSNPGPHPVPENYKQMDETPKNEDGHIPEIISHVKSY
ncbi:ninein [Diachasmimorpha longicaudata]|uniref:ninein n=1 Tax=Diachasmimorpha longicaudata TaxID=58733 RepID=UPI0030B89BE2